MLVYKGINALSDFRRKILLKKLQQADASIQDVQAEYIHFVDCSALNKDEEQKLNNLLTYGEPFNGQQTKQTILVVPRLGTISPWSSKATDIIHSCGLEKVHRAERGIGYYMSSSKKIKPQNIEKFLHDRMTETVLENIEQAKFLFKQSRPKPVREVDIKAGGKAALEHANKKWGMALSQADIDYLFEEYKTIKRNPTDAELMMFAQVNSEHCRHKIFNADWTIDGHPQPKSLFKMIKNTYDINSEGILSAYSDNAAVLEGPPSELFFANPNNNKYENHKESANIVIKVETHNHPTAIAPFPGAATGSGGEIRDENATGRGAKPKMGLSGFSVSNLNIEGAKQPWEKHYGKPERIVSALDIMLEAPIGAAAFNNEFGRPNLAGYFRTYEQKVGGEVRGYHKPIMIAGGLGNIRSRYIQKKRLPAGAKIIVLGGPAMLIGLGGGSGSSMQSGQSDAELDFASVQRANAEMQRRAHEVIASCLALDSGNPILTIHDVGAGGWSNALPELVHDSSRGAKLELRDLPNAEPGLSPMEIWCNESQERYVLGISAKDLELFEETANRERCLFSVVGETIAEKRLVVHDNHFNNNFIDLPMEVLFGKSSIMSRSFNRAEITGKKLSIDNIKIDEAVSRVLQLPAVSSKKFLITIGDRTVGGLCLRDQLVGPWQVPVSDVAVTASSFQGNTGEAMAMGERAPVAVIDAAASARMAVGEALTNIAAANIKNISDVKLSANWMAAAGYKNEDQHLYDAVKAVGEDFCPAIGVTIPVGKDSLSMRTHWQEGSEAKSVTAPMSLIVSAFAPVHNTDKTLTPELQKDFDTALLLIDLGAGQNRLGGSALAQVYNQSGDDAPDADPKLLKSYFTSIQKLNSRKKILAFHDRSDGGLLATLCEMAFASRCGLNIDLAKIPGSDLEKMFNEELGAVIQIANSDKDKVIEILQKFLGEYVYAIGSIDKSGDIIIKSGRRLIYQNSRAQLETWWAKTSYLIQSLRDNPKSAKQEYEAIKGEKDPGISPVVTFKNKRFNHKSKPKVAILREQGVNGQIEMAAAFDMAGFTSIDVHLNDLMKEETSLKDFVGLAVCGGFSYGDVLGAGQGWAKSILFNPKLRAEFSNFFERPDTFSLGVCNGCQMLASLKELIPGAKDWPKFLKNSSEQFEARVASVRINNSPSVFLHGMEGSVLPIPVAHGEGRVQFDDDKTMKDMLRQNLVSMQYVNNLGEVAQTYPFNPNGSTLGITSLTTADGRATILMPHPERAFLTKQLSWYPKSWGLQSPWLRIFQNARAWTAEK